VILLTEKTGRWAVNRLTSGPTLSGKKGVSMKKSELSLISVRVYFEIAQLWPLDFTNYIKGIKR
jgi:hypothetical protein